MGPIEVVVTDANNLVLEVTPTPSTTVILDRGIAGPPGPAGSGDVNGPASSTDNAIARFDGTTGKLIQNSNVLIDDSGNITQPLSVTMANGSGTTVAAGRMWYDDTTGSWNLGMGGGNITQQVGEELFVYGKASVAITDSPLQIVYQTGTVGASGVITFAPTVAGITDGDLIIGAATESLAHNAFGRITSFGVIHGITTNGTAYGETWADGDTIWYNPVTGNPTNIKPVAPNIKVSIGTLIKAGNGGSGSIQIEINHGSVLGGTDSNVQITSAANGNLLTYDATAGYWKNSNTLPGSYTLSGGTANGVAYLNGSKVLTTGSALTFDGTTLAAAATANGANVEVLKASNIGSGDNTQASIGFYAAGTKYSEIIGGYSGAPSLKYNATTTIGYHQWQINGSEQMRLTSSLLTVVPGATIEGLTVGRGAGAVSTNTAVGASALAVNTTGSNDVAIGSSALAANTTGAELTSVGFWSLKANTTGFESTALGAYSLLSNTTGNYNVAIGRSALQSNTTASNNTAVGYQAGYSNTNTGPNTYVGYQAGRNATGAYSIAIGYQAGYQDTDTVNGNIFMGYQAGYANTTGTGILAVGTAALTANTTGSFNTAVGRALISNTTGSYNSAFGYYALLSNTTANYSTAVGYSALTSNNGNLNTAVGAFALNLNTDATDNTAVGYAALCNNNGYYNTAVGRTAMYANTTGGANSAFGYGALASGTTASFNLAIGFQSLGANTTGSYNVAVGGNALNSNTTASNNTAVGSLALYSNTTGDYQTAIGREAGRGVTTGYFNTLIGYAAGYSLTTGYSNCFVGSANGSGSGGLITTGAKNTILGSFSGNQGGLDIRTSSNYIVLSDGDGNPRIYHTSTGSYGEFRVSSVYNNTTATAANVIVFSDGSMYRSTSALKYKQDIRDLEDIDINSFRPVRYKSKCESDDQTQDHFGFIADWEAEAAHEELVTRGANGEVEGFQYERMTAVLTKTAQKHDALIAALAVTIDQLKAELATLKGN